MSLSLLDLPPDPKLAAAANRRRKQEELRKLRIFNPRERLIGIDVDAIRQQVHELNLAWAEEKDREKKFIDQLIKCDNMAVMLEKQQAEEIHKIEQEIDHFRKTVQRPEYRREFDLYDPDLLKKELPPRISDDDPRCTISGVQRLEGEDINYKERMKKQKEQMRDWIEQQMLERRMLLDKYAEEQRQLETKLHQLDQYAVELDRNEKQCRRNVLTATKDFNKSLDDSQKSMKSQAQIADEMQKLQEIYNNYYGDFLTENPYASRSSFGPHRVVPDRWKGMTPEQLQEYYNGQIMQIDENKRRREEQHQEEERWDQLRMDQTKHAILMQRDQNRQIRELQKNQLKLNQQLAREQKMQKDYLEKNVYSNVPTHEYFAQFNTTTR